MVHRNSILYAVALLVIIIGSTDLYGQPDTADIAKVPGAVVKHEPASSGIFVGAPSITVMPEGHYMVSLNYTSIKKGDLGSVHRTAIYASSDRGSSWEFLTEIENQRWSTLFYHRDALFLIGVYEAFGNAIIRKSTDGGYTWTAPADRKSGLLAEGRFHCAPVPVVVHEGRIWRAFEDAPRDREFRTLMMSAPVEADLLDADQWTFSTRLPYDEEWYGGTMRGWLEGNVVVTPEKEIANILRCGFGKGIHGIAAMVRISSDGLQANFDPENDFIRFPGASKKFTIRYDPKTEKYWSLVNWIQPSELKYLDSYHAGRIRNNLSLVSSSNLSDWMIERIVLYHPDIEYHAFQYVDWQFEGKDIIAVSRTAYEDGLGGAANYHDANYITFHRVKDFRNNYNADE